MVKHARVIGWAGVGEIMSLDKSTTARSTSANDDMQCVVGITDARMNEEGLDVTGGMGPGGVTRANKGRSDTMGAWIGPVIPNLHFVMVRDYQDASLLITETNKPQIAL